MKLTDLYVNSRPASPEYYRERFVERFWSKVDTSGGPEACWPWRAATIRGYGLVSSGREHGCLRAHRVAFMLHHGEVDDNLYVCHSCDVRNCCNPRHLWQGTDKDNTQDMIRKGRHRFGPLPVRFGESNPAAKLTPEQVVEIRTRYAAGGVTHATLAKNYDVSRHLIGYIIRGERWSHLEDEGTCEISREVARMNRNPSGEGCSSAKITEAEVLEIRRRYAAGESRHQIARAMGISPSIVYRAAIWKTWKHVGGERRSA